MTLQKSTPGRRKSLLALAAAKRKNKRRIAQGLKPIVEGKKVDSVSKHGGPGDHASGSPQTVHGNGKDTWRDNFQTTSKPNLLVHPSSTKPSSRPEATASDRERLRTRLMSIESGDHISTTYRGRQIEGEVTIIDRNTFRVKSRDGTVYTVGRDDFESVPRSRTVIKHYGPGAHPGTGTDQTVHDPGTGGMGGDEDGEGGGAFDEGGALGSGGAEGGGAEAGDTGGMAEESTYVEGDLFNMDAAPPPSNVPAEFAEPETQLDQSIRPMSLDDFVGQENIKTQLDIMIDSARKRNAPMPHSLFSGPPGLGKTTLANIVGNELGVDVKVVGGSAIKNPEDIAGLVMSLQDGDVLFVDEIHNLDEQAAELLYPAMEDFEMDVPWGEGTMRMETPKFTLIGATTRAGQLPAPLRSRFGQPLSLKPYEPQELSGIVDRTAGLLEINLDSEASLAIATSSRGTPRVANNLTEFMRDYSISRGVDTITAEDVSTALSIQGVDGGGLAQTDRKYLTLLSESTSPVGLGTIAAYVGEDTVTVEDAWEPYLLQQAYIARTGQGRVITDKGLAHLEQYGIEKRFFKAVTNTDPMRCLVVNCLKDHLRPPGSGEEVPPAEGAPKSGGRQATRPRDNQGPAEDETDPESPPRRLAKHGEHDQKSHGNWARGTSADEPSPMRNPDFLDQVTESSPAEFYDGFAQARQGKYGAFLSDFSEEDFDQPNVRVFTAYDGQVGGALTDHGDGRIEVGSLYALPGTPRGAGRDMVRYLVREHDANWLNNFDGPLTKFYRTEGFEVDTRDAWNPEYAPPDWNYDLFGTPDYVTMSLREIRKSNGRADPRGRSTNQSQDLGRDARRARRAIPQGSRQVPGGSVGVGTRTRDAGPRRGPGLTKHYGPSEHLSGSPQTVHAHGSSNQPGAVSFSQADILDGNADTLAELAVNPRPGIDDNPAIVAVATQQFEQALQNEAELSPVLSEVAAQTGGELVGFEHRVKPEASIRDKVYRIMAEEVAAENPISWEEAAARNKDYNRYTLVWPADESWVANHQTTMDALAESGWEIYDHKDKNGWNPGDHYNGMNYQLTNGESFMEIQFHTPESHALKEVSHELYSQARILPPEDPQRQQFISQIWDLWNGDLTHIPPGAESIGTPVNFLMKRQVVSPQEAAFAFYVRADEEGNPSILFRTDGVICEAWGTQTGQWHPTPLTLPEISGLGGSSDYWPVSDRVAMDFIMGRLGEAPRDIRAKGRPTKLGKSHQRIAKADFSPTITVVDSDDPKNLIFGWANVAFTKDGQQVEDHQGHMIDVDDLEHMAYNFVVKYRKSGDMHKSEAFGDLVESMVYTPEKLEVLGLDPGSLPFAWWVGFKLPPEEAQKVRRGERSMLSIEGGARLELVDD